MKPSNGVIYVIRCKKCGNNKANFIDYKNYYKFTCTKCKYKWEDKKLISKG